MVIRTFDVGRSAAVKDGPVHLRTASVYQRDRGPNPDVDEVLTARRGFLTHL
jgi:hypothetical protein